MNLEYFVLRIEPSAGVPQPREARRRADLESLPSLKSMDLGDTLRAAEAKLDVDAAPAPKITGETIALSETQALDAARDPANTLAKVMPVALIRPCASADYGIPTAPDPVALAKERKMSWGIAEVGADKSPLTGEGVRVAVLDSGINLEHPAFKDIVPIARNFTAEGSAEDVTDDYGHGTHCAGTIFGRDVDGVRIGVARGVTTVLVGKVLDRYGIGTTPAIVKALQWAVDQKANVVSMSIAFDFPGMQQRLVDQGYPPLLATSTALKAYRENLRMFETLLSFLLQENSDLAGVVVVAASGNDSLRNRDPNFVIDAALPAAASPDIISVGATMAAKDGLGIAPFSNVNPKLCAPGVDIVSANHRGGLIAQNGTSMACPHVAGLAALWWQSSRKLVDKATGQLVRAQLTSASAARSTGFLPGVTYADRGVGRATAPPS